MKPLGNPEGQLSPHFHQNEFRCRCCGKLPPKGMAKELITKLEFLRGLIGEHVGKETPIRLTCGYRCNKHNAELPGAVKNSYHTKGYAADVAQVPGVPLDVMVKLAQNAGFKRVGKYPEDLFIHVDVGEKPSPAQWVS